MIRICNIVKDKPYAYFLTAAATPSPFGHVASQDFCGDSKKASWGWGNAENAETWNQGLISAIRFILIIFTFDDTNQH